MIEIEIANGNRRGTVLTLDSAVNKNNPVTLLEDEVLVFRLREKEDLPGLALGLHENLVRYTQRHLDGDYWVYEWLPKDRGNGRKEAFFHNFYGIAELCLTLIPHQDAQSPSFVIELQPVEILARKINADRVSAMLEFMSQHDAALLASAIRITRLRSGYRQGGHTVENALDRIQHNLEFLRHALPLIATQPLRRLRLHQVVVTPTPETLIDENSIQWIVENPDHLIAAADDQEKIIEWEDEAYAIAQVLETQSEESTDLYENQVIHGFISTLSQATRGILARLTEAGSTQPGQTTAQDGYVSFFTQIGRFSKTINANKIHRCEAILSELARLHSWLTRAVPVSRGETGKPTFTQKARHTLLYQQVFRKVLLWHSYGQPDWSIQDELTSIKSTDKLFEYYVLSLLRHQLEQIKIGGTNLFKMNEDDAPEEIEYRIGDAVIRLFYEPTFWMAGHVGAAGQELVNTEGWTRYENSDSSPGRSRYSPRARSGANARRTPDYLIEISREGQPSRYLIIDAKYTNRFRAFHDKLPELAMKYLHGIHQQGTGRSLTSALMIVNPDDGGETWHFHTSDYSIYGPTPAIPAMLVTSVDVAKAHKAESNIGRDLQRMLEIHLCEEQASTHKSPSSSRPHSTQAMLA